MQFLSTHKGALTTARRLGHPLFQSQPQSPSVAEGGTGGSGKAQHGGVNDASAAPPRANANRHRGAQRRDAHPDGQPQTPAPAPASSSVPAGEAGRGYAARDAGAGDASAPRANASKRRSAARSAKRHALRRRQIRIPSIALLFVSRLRRRARRRREQEDIGELSDGEPSVTVKRGSADRPSSSSSAGSSSSVAFVIGCQRCDPLNKRVELCHPCADEVAYHSMGDGRFIPPPRSLCSAAEAAVAREGTRRPAKRRGSRWGPALLLR